MQPSLLLDLIAWTLSALSAADSDLWLLLHYWILLWAIISPVKFWATFIISSTLWLLQWQKGEQNGCDVSMFAKPLRLEIRTRNNKRSVNFPKGCCIEKKSKYPKISYEKYNISQVNDNIFIVLFH